LNWFVFSGTPTAAIVTTMMVRLVSEQGKIISIDHGNLLLGRGGFLVNCALLHYSTITVK
jgi:hypothetical protein